MTAITSLHTPAVETGIDETPVGATPADADALTGALAERLFGAGLGALELATVALGDRLGLYRALDRDGASTAPRLAAAAGIDARYAENGASSRRRPGC